jgi:hypothetical protein
MILSSSLFIVQHRFNLIFEFTYVLDNRIFTIVLLSPLRPTNRFRTCTAMSGGCLSPGEQLSFF